MKKILLISAITMLAAMSIFAKKTETMSIGIDQSKVTAAGKITIKFVAIEEDSRCPQGTTCVWAGNARVQISVAKGKKKARTFSLNSTVSTKSVTYEGYDIAFADLTPHPGMNKAIARGKTVVLTVTKHQ
jgi:hypothetical protein